MCVSLKRYKLNQSFEQCPIAVLLTGWQMSEQLANSRADIHSQPVFGLVRFGSVLFVSTRVGSVSFPFVHNSQSVRFGAVQSSSALPVVLHFSSAWLGLRCERSSVHGDANGGEALVVEAAAAESQLGVRGAAAEAAVAVVVVGVERAATFGKKRTA